MLQALPLRGADTCFPPERAVWCWAAALCSQPSGVYLLGKESSQGQGRVSGAKFGGQTQTVGNNMGEKGKGGGGPRRGACSTGADAPHSEKG